MFTLGPTSSTWDETPAKWEVTDEVLTAAAQTDILRSPIGSHVKNNAARALTDPPSGDRQLRARLRVDFHADRDAGVW